jgi:hypothetical protein
MHQPPSPKSESFVEEKEEEKVDESKLKRKRTRMVLADEEYIQKYPDRVYMEKRSRLTEEVHFKLPCFYMKFYVRVFRMFKNLGESSTGGV